MRIVVFWNVVLTLLLAFVLTSQFGHRKTAPSTASIVRATQFVVVDQHGNTKAVLGSEDGPPGQASLKLYSNQGRAAVILKIDSVGNGTLYFQSRQTEGKLALGYLWGSDSLSSKEIEDPLASWGIRVLGENGAQLNFGLLSSGKASSQAAVLGASK